MSFRKGDGSALIEASPLANCTTFTIGNAFAISMGQEVSGVYLMNASFGGQKVGQTTGLDLFKTYFEGLP